MADELNRHSRLCQSFVLFKPDRLNFSLAVTSSESHLRNPKKFLGLGSFPSFNQRSIVLCETANISATWRLLMSFLESFDALEESVFLMHVAANQGAVQ